MTKRKGSKCRISESCLAIVTAGSRLLSKWLNQNSEAYLLFLNGKVTLLPPSQQKKSKTDDPATLDISNHDEEMPLSVVIDEEDESGHDRNSASPSPSVDLEEHQEEMCSPDSESSNVKETAKEITKRKRNPEGWIESWTKT